MSSKVAEKKLYSEAEVRYYISNEIRDFEIRARREIENKQQIENFLTKIINNEIGLPNCSSINTISSFLCLWNWADENFIISFRLEDKEISVFYHEDKYRRLRFSDVAEVKTLINEAYANAI